MMIIAALIFNQVSTVVSQQNECSCTPLKYTWILNLTNPCLPSNIAIGPTTGIEEIFCFVDIDTKFDTLDDSDKNNMTRDGTLVMISSYLFVELNDGNIVDENQTSLIDGNMIEFVSDTTDRPDFVSEGFFAEIIGKNAADEKVELSILIQFTNICGRLPFQEGDRIGWLTYGADTVFREETCFPESHNPSAEPSGKPSSLRNATSSAPSLVPSRLSSEPSTTPSFITSRPTLVRSNKSKKSKSLKSSKMPKSPKNKKSGKNKKSSKEPKGVDNQNGPKGEDQKSPSGKGQKSPTGKGQKTLEISNEHEIRRGLRSIEKNYKEKSSNGKERKNIKSSTKLRKQTYPRGQTDAKKFKSRKEPKSVKYIKVSAKSKTKAKAKKFKGTKNVASILTQYQRENLRKEGTVTDDNNLAHVI